MLPRGESHVARLAMLISKHFRCRFCGVTFSACPGLPLSRADGALLLGHMSQSHPAEL